MIAIERAQAHREAHPEEYEAAPPLPQVWGPVLDAVAHEDRYGYPAFGPNDDVFVVVPEGHVWDRGLQRAVPERYVD